MIFSSKTWRKPGAQKKPLFISGWFSVWAQLGSNQRPPDYERQMRVSTGLHRFVSVCTSLSCCRVIVKDYRVLYQFGGNTGTKTGTRFY